jgi:hypothetical protein
MAPCLAFFLTQSRLRSRRVIPVLQRVLISLRRAASWRLSGESFANFLRNGLTVLSLRGYVGADTKQPYRGALLTK